VNRKSLADRLSASQANVVLMGLPRSGTTLACHLLNKLPDTVALAEPISPGKFADRLPDYEAVCDGIEESYGRMRRMALRDGKVISKHLRTFAPMGE
jgi:hypothetical protein